MEGSRDRKRSRVVVLGTGNVATHLVPALSKNNDVIQIWTRTSGKTFSNKSFNAIPVVSDISHVVADADFYIIAVSDDAIACVASKLRELNVNGIVAHTSGSFPLEKLREVLMSDKTGVFYPLQTFSKDVPVDVSTVPFFIEGSSDDVAESLAELAHSISNDVRFADSTIRGHLHVAAVFSNNFVNYLWDLADSYLKQNVNLDLSVFGPLLNETLRKAIENGPRESQTGPAVRRDNKIIESHLSKLNDEDAEIYRLLTNRIIKRHIPNE